MKSIGQLRESQPNSTHSMECTSLAFFDIETTGLRPDRGARITEIAIYNRNKDQFLWKHEKDQTSDKTLTEQLPIIFDLLTNGVVVGHNVGFDFYFLAYEAERLGLRGPNVLFIDTLRLAKKLDKDTDDFKLSSLLRTFDISVKGPLHTAAVDALATRALFWKLINLGEIETLAQAGMQRLNWSTF